MKTILIPLFDGFIARNLLYTEVEPLLTKNENVRVVIIPPKGKVDYYAKEFGSRRNIVVEVGPFWKHDRFEFIIEKLFLHSIPTNFMRIRQVDWYWNRKKYFAYFGVSILRLLGHIRLWHHFIRFVDAFVPIHPYVYEVMDRWQPDMIFAPTMIARDEVALMRVARKRGVRVVGMVKSWDNLTSKAFLRFFPDHMIVHTNIVKREAMELYGYPEERITVTGLPQYDDYLKEDFVDSREDFFRKIGGDPTKKLITFAPAGDWMSLHDKEILEQILGWIDSGVLSNVQVLLRLHPAYESKTEELVGRAHLIVERPGKHFDAATKDAMLKTVEFGIDEMKHLASTMKWSDVTVNTASTMSIEAAIFDTPIILLGIDGERVSYWRSVRRYYDREHYRSIVESKGATLVFSHNELQAAIRKYLSDRQVDHTGRRRIQQDQCFMLDGKASERVANVLSNSLQ